jgi:plasmid stabilization system protein ParE
MAVKPLDIHPAALEELKSALAWYLDRSATAASNFVREVDEAIDLVAKSPGRWPSGEHATRKFVLRRFPFAIVYRETERPST